jgi:hypothetical protein
MTRRSGTGMLFYNLYFSFFFTNICLYIVAIYDDATVRHNRGRGKVGPNDVSRCSGPGMFYLFIFFLLTIAYIYIIAHYDDVTARHDGGEGLPWRPGIFYLCFVSRLLVVVLHVLIHPLQYKLI